MKSLSLMVSDVIMDEDFVETDLDLDGVSDYE